MTPVRVDPEEDLYPPRARRLVDSPDRGERVQRPVAAEVGAPDRRARRDAVDEPGHSLRVQDPGIEPLGADHVRDRPQAGQLGGGLGQEEVAGLAEPDVVAELPAEPPIRGDRLPGQTDRRPGIPLLADATAVAAAGSGGEEAPVHDQDRSGARAGQVVGREEADDARADDRDRVARPLRRRHACSPSVTAGSSVARAARGVGRTGGRWVM